MADTLKLYAAGEPVNGKLSVIVDPGSEAEALWRENGYLPEDELAKRKLHSLQAKEEKEAQEAEAAAKKAEAAEQRAAVKLAEQAAAEAALRDAPHVPEPPLVPSAPVEEVEPAPKATTTPNKGGRPRKEKGKA
jgi:hypothetical protein